MTDCPNALLCYFGIGFTEDTVAASSHEGVDAILEHVISSLGCKIASSFSTIGFVIIFTQISDGALDV